MIYRYVNSSRRILFACNIASGGSRGGAWGGPLFLDQTEAPRAEKNCFGDQTPSPYLWVLMTGPALSEGLDLPLIATKHSNIDNKIIAEHAQVISPVTMLHTV